jgi:hypothetical protein
MNLFCLKPNKKKTSFCIRRHQSQFPGYVMRKAGLENVGTTGKIEGRRNGDREHESHEKMLDSSITCHGMRSTEDMFRCMTNVGL